MKHHGFTLAEILITLSIVGVVAALSLPGLITRANDQANATKLGTCISTLENVFGTMIVREDVENISQTAFAQDPTAENLQKYLSQVTLNDGTYTMKNGATFKLSEVNDGATMDIDVNGDERPNSSGKDKFKYTLNSDGTLTPGVDDPAATLAKNNYKIK